VTDQEKLQTELREILLLVSEGQSSPEQESKLCALIVENPAARSYVVSIMHQFAALESTTATWKEPHCEHFSPLEEAAVLATINRLKQETELGAAPGEIAPGRIPLPEPVSDASSLMNAIPRHFLTWMPLLIAVIMGVLIGRWSNVASQSDSGSNLSSPESVAARSNADANKKSAVATLTMTNGCDWGNTTQVSYLPGNTISSGDEINLHEGIASFRLASSDVTLTVEGPASLVITSSNSLILQQGKVTAHVPWKESNFQIVAGMHRLTGFDSEYGVEVKGNNTAVHVFSGEVSAVLAPYSTRRENQRLEDEVLGADDESLAYRPIAIKQSEAVEFTSDSSGNASHRFFKANQNHFASKISMAERLPITPRYVNSVLASKPLGYWRFEAVKDNQIRNEIENGTYLKVTTALSLPGDDSNRVLELGQTFARGNLVSADTFDAMSKSEYSVELWAKPSHYHRGILVAFASQAPSDFPIHGDFQYKLKDWPERDSFGLEVQASYGVKAPGTFHSANHNPFKVSTHECFSRERLYSIRRWQHIVVVKGRSAMIMYVNGKAVGQVSGSKTMLPGMHLVVGRPFPSFNDYPFVGQIDELSVYDRVITAKEVSEHYNAVKETGLVQPEI
jgi:hypothetical protein